MMNPAAGLRAMTAVLVCTGVSGLAAAEEPAGAPSPGRLATTVGGLLSEVERRFGSEARVLSLELEMETGEATAALQDPAVPSHVDRYAYREGALADPEPVAVGRNARSIRARLFRAREVQASILPALVASRWRVHVEGPRGGGYVEYALDGKQKRVLRW